MGNHERDESNSTPEPHEISNGSLIPIEAEVAQQVFAEIAAGMDLSHVVMRQMPTMEEIENGVSFLDRDLPTDIAILLGYRDDLVYRSTTDQGTVAYLRAVELQAEALGLEAPIFDTPVLDIFDDSLLGSDSNMRELVREQVISEQRHKGFSNLTQGVEPARERVHISFVGHKRFFLDADAQLQRRPALIRGFHAIWEREGEYVEAYRQSPLYVDDRHERAFLVPASILNPMVNIKEQITSFKKAFGEQK